MSSLTLSASRHYDDHLYPKMSRDLYAASSTVITKVVEWIDDDASICPENNPPDDHIPQRNRSIRL